MKEIFAQWYEPNDEDKVVYYFYHVKNNMFRFSHWESTMFREYDPDSSRFKEHTRFKLTLIK